MQEEIAPRECVGVEGEQVVRALHKLVAGLDPGVAIRDARALGSARKDNFMTFDPAAAGWEPYTDEGFIGLVGPFWRRQIGDTYLYAFTAAQKHHNRRGVVQGGMLMTFADRAMGMTCWYANGQRPQATVQLDVQFVDAVQIGEFVEAKCQVLRRTRALVFMRGEFVVGGRVVFTANGIWKTLGAN